MYIFFRVTYRIVILSFFLQFILYIILESLLNKKLFVKRSIMPARIICIYFSRLNFFASDVIWFTMMWIDRYRKPLHRITRYIIYEQRENRFLRQAIRDYGRPRQSVLVSFARRLRYFSGKKDFYRRLYLNADIDVAVACVAKRARGVPLGFTTFEQ